MSTPIVTLLPDIEDAVVRRRECAALLRMNADELRELVYGIVRSYREDHDRPVQVFRMLVASAVESQQEFVSAREASLAVRHDLLVQLRSILQPVLSGLLGPITIETLHIPKQHDQYVYHPVLHGIQILDNGKWGPVAKDMRAWSGSSVWLVALPPDGGTVDARYAVAEHRGEVHAEEGGRTSLQLRLVNESELAHEIRDHQFKNLLITTHKRLSALSGRGVTTLTDEFRTATSLLQGAIDGMRAER